MKTNGQDVGPTINQIRHELGLPKTRRCKTMKKTILATGIFAGLYFGIRVYQKEQLRKRLIEETDAFDTGTINSDKIDCVTPPSHLVQKEETNNEN